MSKKKISEKVITTLWQSRLNEAMVADTGDLIRVIYPGRQSGDSGPDFHDAVICVNRRITKGDIEIHTDASQWFLHRHHHDSQYNKTILQVVINRNCGCPAATEQGTRVPTVCLSPFANCLPRSLRRLALASFSSLPCSQIHRVKDRSFLSLLEAAGRKRFELKVDRFRENLRQEEAGQVLLSSIMRALGYSRNTEPFEKLSYRLSPSFLNQLRASNGILIKQAYLLGIAGLLPYQRQQKQRVRDREAKRLEGLWRTLDKNQIMNEVDWQFTGVRPTNFPVRRLVALSHLLNRYSNPGLPCEMLRLVVQAPVESGHLFLENSLMVITNGYWSKHFDFGVATNTGSALLGRGKAAEVVINVILPFTYAWAKISGEPELREKAYHLFHSYPRLADNEITQHMRQQLKLKDLPGISLVHQQGLIHIFNTYCREGNCQGCPLVNCPG